ncbi:DUF423 domain-containing protein [Flavobacterium sp. '19STA2R22 D10 B1']|uniref:DUF423 domain-containing protein n=1 Tax=Flavobacterium aerium TaxID=3037261 RepID=UPI00278C7B04|nr:DUF423 domain-containing protein [Flavobacterium sp. '19STA2R22 D10 B1']
MKEFVFTVAGIYGALAVIFGAFGAHALKKTFTDDLLKNFETGVKYQMYHALVLLFIGTQFSFTTTIEQTMAYSFIIGIFLFSFSIYGLCLSSAKNKKLRFLGPITPLGGLLLVLGWVLMIVQFQQNLS